MRPATLAFLLLFFTALFAGAAGTASPPPAAQTPQPAPASEAHEGMTITAVPWVRAETYKAKFPKKNPHAAGILAIHTVFQNDSGETIRVNLDQIRLVLTLEDNSRQNLEPLTADDVATAVLKGKMKDPSRRGPLSMGNPGKDWTDLQTRATDAGINSNIVPPHDKLEGLLYFDLNGQFDLVDRAHLYIPELSVVGRNHQMLYFELEFEHTARR